MEFLEILSPSALKDLQTANLEVVKLVANIDKVGQNMAKIATPSGSDSATKKLVSDYQTLEKQLAKTQQQLEKNRLQEIRLAQAREKAFDKYDAQLAKEQAKLNASSNLYNKVQQKLNVLSNEYKALATQKELTGRLTDKEAQRYDFLQGKIQKYDATLKAVDATMGKYQRNVGNYASGFNSLGNSVNQLTREMPAFTNSVQTGFMALSNNIPIFTDAIGNAIAQNKALQAEGKPTTSILKQLAGAFFSWQTLLGVGITLLTVYGKEIGEFISELTNADQAINELNKSQKEYNKARIEGRKSAQAEILELRKYLAVVNDEKLTDEQRKIAKDALLKQYPFYIRSVKDAMIVDGQYSQGVKNLITALEKRKEVEKKSELNVINRQKLIDLQTELDLQNKRIQKAQKLFDVENAKPIIADRATAQANRNKLLVAEQQLNSANEKGISIQKTINQITKQSIKNDEDIIKLKKETIGLEYQEEKITKNNTKAKREDIEAVNGQIQTNEGYLKRLKDQRKGFQDLQQQVSDTSKEFQDFQTIIDGLTQSINLIEDPSKVIKSDGINEFMKIYSNRVKTGLDETKGFWEQHGQEVVDLSQDLINTLAEISNAQFEQQYQRLEKERDIAIMFAGESVSAREEIERQYEKRRASIQRKQAEAEKKMAVFNIITDTAQAIVASLVRDPTGTLAILIGAIGAAQLGLVLSQPIPQFAKGTDNAPEGWALTQEKGREIITDKYGKVKSLGNDKGAQYTYLNKGDKVFTNQDTEAMLFNSNLNNMLLGNGIAMPKVEVSMDTTILGGKIDNLANTIANKEGLTIVRDERGERKYLRKQNETKELLNNVLTYKGIDV